ncbi:hypothetical protein [Aureimonas mangrovi]|uniref:hypothetical protein n=1 Tax=Aureimonas mangrovi TaxID=2758041 RepID=UPI00163D4B9B|nr:hypothetical protein [Aureimonas mangrovi]
MTGATTVGPAPADIAKHREALLVLDVDEVVLHFVEPFCALLEENGARMHFDSFALTGNVRSLATGAAVSGQAVGGFTRRLYEEQETRQRPVDGVAPALERLSRIADIVFLTAMTPSFHTHRRRLLDAAGLRYPMIATERSKGGIVAELAERWHGPIVFVDDLPPNLAGVRRSLARTRLLHLMANDGLRPHLPPLPEGAEQARNWAEAEPLLETMLRG